MKKLVDYDVNTTKETGIKLRTVENTIKDIAIIGMAAKLPMAEDVKEFWENLRKGVDCVREIPEGRKKDLQRLLPYMNLVGAEFKEIAYLDEIDKFDYNFFGLSPKEASLMDPNQRLFLENAWKAIEDSGYGGEKIAGTNTGVYVGFGGEIHYYNLVKAFEPQFAASVISSNLAPIIASRIAYILDLRGPSVLLDTACSSSLVALHMACQGLRNRECDLAIAGGVKIIFSPMKVSGGIGIESSDGRTRAFDDSSDGTGWGEGVASVVLKPLAKALEDNDNIYAVIKGSAINQDGTSVGITAPNPEAQEEVIVKAWKNSGVDPQTISYIETHGTGTKLGDPIEIEGLQGAFARYTDKKHFCPIGSVKTNIGHLDNAAGIAGLIKVILSLKHGEIPASLHFSKPNSKIDFADSPVYVNDKLQKWESNGLRRCGVSSFGLSGTNCHVVLEEAPGIKISKKLQSNRCNILTLSAKSKNSLQNLIKQYYRFVECDPNLVLDDICYTANTGRWHFNYRLAIVAMDNDDLRNKLQSLIDSNLMDINDEAIFYGEIKNADEQICQQVEPIVKRFVREGKEDKGLLSEICRLYAKGGNIIWNEFYRGEKHNRISLPTYPFERIRCWIDVPEKEIAIEPKNVADGKEKFYEVRWENEELPENTAKKDFRTVLIFMDQVGKGNQIAGRLRECGREVITVELGEGYREVDKSRYIIGGDEDDYLKILSDIKADESIQLLHLMTLSNKCSINTVEELEESQKRGVYSLFNIVKAAVKNSDKKFDIVLISENANNITGNEEIIDAENATLLGLGKTVSKEYPVLACRSIDIDRSTDIDNVIEEISAASNTSCIAYRNGKRYVEMINKVNILKFDDKKLDFKEDGVYIITGGTGGIGIEVCKYIASKARVNLALINRSEFPERCEWNSIIENGDNKKLSSKLKSIIEIEKSGSEVNCMSADVSDENQMRHILKELRDKYGKINGIIHAAGVVGDGFIINKDFKKFREVLLPKVNGTWVLDNLTRDDEMDFFIMFSSLASIVGAPGQGDYTAANSYLDSYQAYRGKKNRRTVAVNWTGWKDAGMAADHEVKDEGIFKLLKTAEAIEAFDTILNKDVSRIIIGQLNNNVVLGNKDSMYLHRTNEAREEEIIPQKAAKISPEPKKQDVVLKGGSGNYTDLEKKIANIMGNVLGLEEVDINDDFFEIGGHSLNATLLLSTIHKEMNVEILLMDLFEIPTVKTLAEHIMEAEMSNYMSIARSGDMEYYPLSSAQKRMYILNQLEADSTAYNIVGTVMLEGKLDTARFEDAFKKLIARHEILRTSFEIVDDEPVQKICEDFEFYIECFEDEEEKALKTIQKLIRPFDLKKAPLLNVSIVKVKEDRNIMVYSMHHIISDGVSMNVIIREFSEIYNGKQLPQLRIQYKDYCVWQGKLFENGILKKQEEYWMRVFKEDVPLLNLPLDYVRPAVQSFEGDSLSFETGREIKERMNTLARETGTTSYMILLAAFNTLLMRYTGQEDIVVGSPIAGRHNADLKDMIGMFVNTLAMRNHPCGNKTFRDFLCEVKENALRAYENQDYPFEDLVEKLEIKRDMSRNPIFDVMLVLQNMGSSEIELEDLKLSPYVMNNGISKFDLSLNVMEGSESIYFSIEYASKLFKKETIKELGTRFEKVLEEVLKNPETKMSELDILTDEEKKKIILEFNDTKSEFPKDKTIHQLFEEQVLRTPDNVAVVFEDNQLTYRELNEKSNQLARVLREKGVKPDGIVGIMVKRSFEMMIGIMGILKAGGAYLPIDPDYPDDRIQYMIDDSGAAILLTQGGVSKGIKGEVEIIDLNNDTLYSGESKNPGCVNRPENLAYVIYTSGSTGKPKGVMIEHYSLINRLNWMQKQYKLSEEDVILQKTPYTFDVSLWELFWWSLTGAKVCLLKAGGEKDPKDIIDAIEKHKVTTIHFVPSMLSTFLHYLDDRRIDNLSTLRQVFASGEALTLQQVKMFNKKLYKKYHTKLHNLYGPTEATVDVSYFDCSLDEDLEMVPIGKPIDNIKLYIADKNKNLQPVGIPGELLISGDGVARGYLNKPELSAEKFLPNPWAEGERIYCTGDLARWLPDGNIEYLGRLDHQVKIRGFRIELGEIEALLMKHPSVKEAVVIDRTDNSGDKYLCAYMVLREEINVSSLREHLSRELPEYMIPTCFVQLDKLPLTSNGKLDRKALPEPWDGTFVGTEYEAPTNEIQERLIAIWSEVLGKNKIGINDNFFELGGHSLKATILVSKIHKEMSVEIPLKAVFGRPTVKGLAEYIKEAEESIYTSIELSAKREYYPLSSAQRRQFILNQLDEDSIAYNLPGTVVFKGKMDREQFESAFVKLIERHETLRTSFDIIDGEPVQKIHQNVEFHVEYYEAYEEGAKEIISGLLKPFDLRKAPLFRVALVKVKEDKHIMLYDMHHIISDGVSLNVITREFAELYRGKELPQLRIQYRDYTLWQKRLFEEGVIKKQEEFWKETFKEEIPVLNLHTDFIRPVLQSFEGDSLEFDTDIELKKSIDKIAGETGATIYMVMLAAFNVFLMKYTGQDDIIVGSPIAGRPHADLESMVGMFVNTLAMRNRPKAEKTFKEFLYEVKENALGAYENQDYQFEELIEKLDIKRDTSRNPLFDVMLIPQNAGSEVIELEGLSIEPYRTENKVSKYDLSLTSAEGKDRMYFRLEYCTKLFTKQTIEGMAKHFINLLKELTKNPNTKLSEIEMLSEDEKRQLIFEFNETKSSYSNDKTIHELFEEQVRKFKDNTAVIFNEDQITYNELNNKANLLAKVLREKGVKPDSIVALMAQPSIEMIISIMAVLKSGGAYLPIDPDYPDDRIRYMLNDSGSKILLTTIDPGEELGFEGEIIDIKNLLWDDEDVENLPCVNSSRNLAYIIYTSGSTGNPKGVMVEHRSLINFIEWRIRRYEIGPKDKILQLISVSFDGFGANLYSSLLCGGCLVLPAAEVRYDYSSIRAIIKEHKVTNMSVVPAMLRSILEGADKEDLASLKSVILAGEKSDRELLNLSNSVLPHTTLINEYGPTENTITTTSLVGLTAEKSSVIGKPIANNKIYVLGENNNLVPQGVPGELCICGDGLARGYLNREELTHEKFITCPFNPKERLYKTGDLVRWLPDGNIEFLGRIDQQVKIRGYRIEIGEIETQLLKHASVKEAAVSDKEDKRGNRYLCAYFTAERELTVAELREHLSNELPDYMIPAYFIQVENMPVTSNGKIDKKSLPEPDGKINTGAEYVAPGTSEEIILAKIWEDVLQVERIGINDEFLNAGGDSMKALKVITEAKKHNIDLAVQDIFKYKTIENVLKNISKSKNQKDKQVSESSHEAKVVKVEELREIPDFYEIYTEEVKELQIEMQRDVTIYLYRSLPLCVLLSDPGLHSWFFENYVNIYSSTNRNGLISLDYLELWANYSTVLGEVSLGADIIENEKDIINFITQRLDKKYYVNIAVDEFYLPGKQKYQKIHYIHEVLVYGYDNLERKLKTVGFDESGIFNNIHYSYEDFKRAYENGKQYYAEAAPWAREVAVHLFYHKGFKQPYPFSMERFLNKLGNYINCVGDGSVIYAWAQNEEKVHYGMDVYDELAKHLKEAIYGKVTVDYRAIHLLAEHKKVLAKRFEYIISKFGLEGRIVTLYNEYVAFAEQVNKIRLKAYEFESIASDASGNIDPQEVVRNISEMVDSIIAAKKKESVLLGEIYEILKSS